MVGVRVLTDCRERRHSPKNLRFSGNPISSTFRKTNSFVYPSATMVSPPPLRMTENPNLLHISFGSLCSLRMTESVCLFAQDDRIGLFIRSG